MRRLGHRGGRAPRRRGGAARDRVGRRRPRPTRRRRRRGPGTRGRADAAGLDVRVVRLVPARGRRQLADDVGTRARHRARSGRAATSGCGPRSASSRDHHARPRWWTRSARSSAAAADRDLTVGLEFHGGTLTATAESVTALLDAGRCPEPLDLLAAAVLAAAPRPASDDAADVRGTRHRGSRTCTSTSGRAPRIGARSRRVADRWRAVLTALRTAPAPDRAGATRGVARVRRGRRPGDAPAATPPTLHELLEVTR